MKKSSFTYKMLKWADTKAYNDLDWHGTTTACNIVQGFIKAVLKAIGLTGAILFGASAACFLLCAFGSVFAYLLLPLLSILGIESLLPLRYYELGITLTVVLGIFTLLIGMGNAFSGEMRVVPNWMKRTTNVVVDNSPHWLTLWWKGVKEKTCYIIKLEK